MRKIFICILLILTILLTTACSSLKTQERYAHNHNIQDNISYVNSDYIKFVTIEDMSTEYGYMIVYDQHTGVMYCLVTGFRAAVITPIYNNDGTVKIYEGYMNEGTSNN